VLLQLVLIGKVVRLHTRLTLTGPSSPVASICRGLTQHGVLIVRSTYYAAESKSRPRSARSIAEQAMLAEVIPVHSDPAIGVGLYEPTRCGTGSAGPAAMLPAAGRTVDANRWRSRGTPRKGVRHHQGQPCRDPPTGPGESRLHRRGQNHVWVLDFT